jgi:hypothetical protein
MSCRKSQKRIREDIPMSSTKKDFLTKLSSNLDERIEEQEMRPRIEVWPGDDDFAHWVAYHEAKERAVICSTPEYKDTPFCGTGCH